MLVRVSDSDSAIKSVCTDLKDCILSILRKLASSAEISLILINYGKWYSELISL